VDKTQVREAVTEVKKIEVVDEPQKESVADDYKVISEGATNIGKAWQDSDANAGNKTAVMSSVEIDSDTAAMPVVDQELMATLKCTTKPLSGETFNLLKKINTVGRTDDNDIRLNESSVSSKHAEIMHKNGSWLIQDLGSYNGTFVNNEKCQSKKLKDGDVINLGRVQLIFSNEEASSVPKRFKWLPSGLKVPVLLVKTVVLLVIVSVISEFAYNYISKLKFDDELNLSLAWENISPNRINPAQPVITDMNNDGVEDVVITSENGVVEVIDGGNGFKLSSFDSGLNLYSSPLLIDVGSDNKMDIVNISSTGEVKAFDVNGSQLWTNTDMQGQLLVAQAVAVNINKDNVADIVLPTEKNGIVILDGETGKQYVQLNGIKGKVISRPIVQDVNRDGVTDIVAITDTNQLVAFSIQQTNIRKLWEVSVPPVLTAPLKFGIIKNHGVIFIATQNSGVYALNSYTGNKIWQSKIDDLLFSAPVLIDTDGDNINDAVVQTTYSGNVVVLDAAKGDQIWAITLPNKIQTEPVVINNSTDVVGQLLFTDTAGMTHTVNIENGDVINSKKINKADRFVV
ncbi:MAG: FHA domain-containing protein, partial [Thiotrichaceae bacterium]|nr:FHA domain-containing protein [Thiotrichaceae bacterium]